MARFHILLGLTVCFFAWLFFLAFPNLDLHLASHFYNESGNYFIGNYDPALIFLHRFAKIFPIVISIIVILFLLSSLIIKALQLKCRKEILFVILCLWIGPGLIVNAVFKDHWGRPRPAMVQEFNGDKIFQKPFVISSQCNRNCSFVCGDASVGFWLFAFMPLFIRRKKKALAFALAILAGGGLGWMRMAQGGHFFSDVVFSGIVVYISTWAVYAIMYRKTKPKH